MEYLKTYELFGFNRKKSYVQRLITQDDVRDAFLSLRDEGWKVDINSVTSSTLFYHKVYIRKPISGQEFNTSEIYDDVMGALDYLKAEHNIKLKKVDLVIDWSARGRGGSFQMPEEEKTLSRFPSNENVSYVILYLRVR